MSMFNKMHDDRSDLATVKPRNELFDSLVTEEEVESCQVGEQELNENHQKDGGEEVFSDDYVPKSKSPVPELSERAVPEQVPASSNPDDMDIDEADAKAAVDVTEPVAVKSGRLKKLVDEEQKLDNDWCGSNYNPIEREEQKQKEKKETKEKKEEKTNGKKKKKDKKEKKDKKKKDKKEKKKGKKDKHKKKGKRSREDSDESSDSDSDEDKEVLLSSSSSSDSDDDDDDSRRESEPEPQEDDVDVQQDESIEDVKRERKLAKKEDKKSAIKSIFVEAEAASGTDSDDDSDKRKKKKAKKSDKDKETERKAQAKKDRTMSNDQLLLKLAEKQSKYHDAVRPLSDMKSMSDEESASSDTTSDAPKEKKTKKRGRGPKVDYSLHSDQYVEDDTFFFSAPPRRDFKNMMKLTDIQINTANHPPITSETLYLQPLNVVKRAPVKKEDERSYFARCAKDMCITRGLLFRREIAPDVAVGNGFIVSFVMDEMCKIYFPGKEFSDAQYKRMAMKATNEPTKAVAAYRKKMPLDKWYPCPKCHKGSCSVYPFPVGLKGKNGKGGDDDEDSDADIKSKKAKQPKKKKNKKNNESDNEEPSPAFVAPSMSISEKVTREEKEKIVYSRPEKKEAVTIGSSASVATSSSIPTPIIATGPKITAVNGKIQIGNKPPPAEYKAPLPKIENGRIVSRVEPITAKPEKVSAPVAVPVHVPAPVPDPIVIEGDMAMELIESSEPGGYPVMPSNTKEMVARKLSLPFPSEVALAVNVTDLNRRIHLLSPDKVIPVVPEHSTKEQRVPFNDFVTMTQYALDTLLRCMDAGFSFSDAWKCLTLLPRHPKKQFDYQLLAVYGILSGEGKCFERLKSTEAICLAAAQVAKAQETQRRSTAPR